MGTVEDRALPSIPSDHGCKVVSYIAGYGATANQGGMFVNTVLMVVFAVFLLFFILFIIGTPLHPVRWMGRFIVRILVGAFLLFLLNVIGESFSLHVPINLATVAVSGLLGIPGIAALVFIKYTLGV